MFCIFRRAPRPTLFLKVKNAPCLFLKVKNAPCLLLKVKIAPCSFLEVKNAPCVFFKNEKKIAALFLPSVERKNWILAENRKMLLEICVQKNSCTQKQQILRQNAILSLHGETFKKRSEKLLMP